MKEKKKKIKEKQSTESNTAEKFHSLAARGKILTKQGQRFLPAHDKCHLFYCCSWPQYTPCCGKAPRGFFLQKKSDIWSEVSLELRLGMCTSLLVNLRRCLNAAKVPVWRLQLNSATSRPLKKQENTWVLPLTRQCLTKAFSLFWIQTSLLKSNPTLQLPPGLTRIKNDHPDSQHEQIAKIETENFIRMLIII